MCESLELSYIEDYPVPEPMTGSFGNHKSSACCTPQRIRTTAASAQDCCHLQSPQRRGVAGSACHSPHHVHHLVHQRRGALKSDRLNLHIYRVKLDPDHARLAAFARTMWAAADVKVHM
jgi:hypothetical protein